MSKKSSQFSTIHRQQLMLKALVAYNGIITRAAKAAGITPQTHYNWYRGDENYASEVDIIKYQCHEQFKDLVMDAVMTKIRQGNTAIIAMCYKSLFKDISQRMEHQRNPFREQVKVGIKLVGRPPINYSQDEETQAALREYEQSLKKTP